MTTPAGPTVSWYKPADLETIEALMMVSYPEEAWTVEDLKKFVSKTGRNNIIKVLKINDSLFGAILYSPSPEQLRLRRLAVFPEFRRQGYGTRLLNAIVRPCGSVRERQIVARVRQRNWEGANLMRKIGFVFDPDLPRERDKQGEEFYLFVYTKPNPVTLLSS